MELRLEQRGPGTRCAYCHDRVEQPSQACAACAADYHFECLVDELGGYCAVYGCNEQRVTPTRAERCFACEEAITAGRRRSCPGCTAVYHVGCVQSSRCMRSGCGGRINPRARSKRGGTARRQAEAVSGVLLVVAALAVFVPAAVVGGVILGPCPVIAVVIGFVAFLRWALRPGY